MDEPRIIKNKPTSEFNIFQRHLNHLIQMQSLHTASAFKQQKLPAWQPILTADTVLPLFFLIGIAFIPIGVGLLLSSNQVDQSESLDSILI